MWSVVLWMTCNLLSLIVRKVSVTFRSHMISISTQHGGQKVWWFSYHLRFCLWYIWSNFLLLLWLIYLRADLRLTGRNWLYIFLIFICITKSVTIIPEVHYLYVDVWGLMRRTDCGNKSYFTSISMQLNVVNKIIYRNFLALYLVHGKHPISGSSCFCYCCCIYGCHFYSPTHNTFYY